MRSANLSVLGAAVIATAVGCSGNQGQCSATSRLVNGSCRPICASDTDCLTSEHCDPTALVCEPNGAPPVDGGVTDAMTHEDAGIMDASHPMHRADILFVIQNSVPMLATEMRLQQSLPTLAN